MKIILIFLLSLIQILTFICTYRSGYEKGRCDELEKILKNMDRGENLDDDIFC